MSVKEEVMRAIERLPDDATVEDAIERQIGKRGPLIVTQDESLQKGTVTMWPGCKRLA